MQVIIGYKDSLPDFEQVEQVVKDIGEQLQDLSLDEESLVSLLVNFPDLCNSYYKSKVIQDYRYFVALCKGLIYKYQQKHVKILQRLLILQKGEILAQVMLEEKNDLYIQSMDTLEVHGILYFCLFKVCQSISELTLLVKPTQNFISFITECLPFKSNLKSMQDAYKVQELVQHYNLVDKTLVNISQYWSLVMQAEHSQETQNKILTIILYNLMHYSTNKILNRHLLQGIQNRMASTDIKFRNSGMVIASKISQLVEKDQQSFQYTIEQYIESIPSEQTNNEIIEEQQDIIEFAPSYLIDLVVGLQSDDNQRFINALKSSESLIKEDLDDLDVQLEPIVTTLLTLSNKFDYNQFDQLRTNSLVALLELRLQETIDIFDQRLSQGDIGLSDQMIILEVLHKFGSNIYTKTQEIQLPHQQNNKNTRYFYRPKTKPIYQNTIISYFGYLCKPIIKNFQSFKHKNPIIKALQTLKHLINLTGKHKNEDITRTCIYIYRNCFNQILNEEDQDIKDAISGLRNSLIQKLSNNPYLEDFAIDLINLY